MSLKLTNLKMGYHYFYAFLIIYSTAGILSQKYPGIINLIMVLLTLPYIFSLLNKKYIIFLSLFIPAFFSSYYLNYNESLGDLLGFIIRSLLVLSFVAFCFNKKLPLLTILSNVMVIISCYSLITYFIFDWFSIISPSGTEEINSKPYERYLGFHYHWQTANWYGYLVPRNNSIFWEPGVYQIFLNFSVIIFLFLNNESKNVKKKLFFLFVSVISTLSTTGIILSCTIVFLKLINKSKSKLASIVKITTFPIVIVGLVGLSIYVAFQKITYGVTSTSLRTEDLYYGFKTFQDKPLLGWGFSNFSGYETYTGTTMNSNGLIFVLFNLGILGFSVYIVLLLGIVYGLLKEYGWRAALVFFIYIVVSMANEPISYNNYIILFLCIGLHLIFNKGKRISLIT